MILRLADFLDRQESRARRVAERFGYAPWLEEFRTYLGDPRLSLEEFFCRLTLMRMETAPKFAAIRSQDDATAFYANPYVLWRQVVHRRHSAWRRVLWTMKGDVGNLLEVGCGIAPVSAYCAGRKQAWTYVLVDVDSPHRRYGFERVVGRCGTAWRGEIDVLSHAKAEDFGVITALDVFEHLPDPEATARQCVEALHPGGHLHHTFVETSGTELDLATPEQREATIAYLNAALRPVYARDGYYVSVKP